MTKKYKISFLMAAHNEAKLISKALERLIKIHQDYPKMEVLIGMDGCTDKTPEIVKRFAKKNKFFKIFELNERKGKQAVLDKLEPHITGEIVIIHDADLCFVYKSKKDLLEFLSLFDNPKIGAIADSLDSEMSKPNFSKICSMGFLASAWGNHFLNDYMKAKFTKRVGKIMIIDKSKMKFCPFVDIYKKNIMSKTKHKQELRAGDHVERTLRILNSGYDVAFYKNKSWPHFNEIYNKQSIKGVANQKIRGIISKKKIQGVYDYKISFWEFYIPFLFYIIKESLKIKRVRDFIAIYVYLFVMFYSIIVGNIKSKRSVKEVWNLRVER